VECFFRIAARKEAVENMDMEAYQRYRFAQNSLELMVVHHLEIINGKSFFDCTNY